MSSSSFWQRAHAWYLSSALLAIAAGGATGLIVGENRIRLTTSWFILPMLALLAGVFSTWSP